MEKINCAISKVLDFQLGSGAVSCQANASSTTGFDLMVLMPYMTIPFLLVLMAGLLAIDQYRRKTSL
ncbi:hypothetical protein ACFOTA_10735 [Chitinophaga sp. GCM10012297]|uniref:Uncharacterized protein n=1 Tax=Chitinophaga chungangae TaxID=2821488 RepID=A0ABS3YDC4_9BACT|nr:hypothetical protein [Chitinophaga chungangae]MBO9152684.1 hypothetical protein [Chitinophaga chungangae]